MTIVSLRRSLMARLLIYFLLLVLTYFLLLAMAVSAVMLLSGCAAEKKPPDQVTVQLKWVHQAQFAGFYAAEKKGFYAEENIDVDLKPGGPGISIDMMIADLISGESTFAIRGDSCASGLDRSACQL